MMVCHGDTLVMDGLCAAIEALSDQSTVFGKNNTDADADCLLSWRGYPDEEPDPYLVGAVT